MFGANNITGSVTLNAGFPGQWFQVEDNLYWNWHRHYDTTTGRYLQPDPMGLATLLSDGPSVCAYAGQSPQVRIDPRGLFNLLAGFGGSGIAVAGQEVRGGLDR